MKHSKHNTTFLLIALIIAVLCLSCNEFKLIERRQYMLFDSNIPSGYVYERRNGYLYIANDTITFTVKTPCEMYHIGNYFNYTYKVGEYFCKDSIRSKITKWKAKK